MAEYEVDVHLEGETDVEIDMKQFTYKEILILLWKVIRGQIVTFEDVYVELGGETYVEIEPQDRY